MILVYITCKDREEAEKVSRHLLEKKLIACGNTFPIESFYRWEGKITEDREVVLIAKTRGGRFEEIKKEVKKIHSYEVPCILRIDVKEANEGYIKWVREGVKR